MKHMIKAMIIDDEKLIREGLVTYIDWAALGERSGPPPCTVHRSFWPISACPTPAVWSCSGKSGTAG